MLTEGAMGTADRDYSRGMAGGGGFMSRLTPVAKWLLIANVAVFLLDLPLRHLIRDNFAFSIPDAVLGGRIWEFLTFQFLHFGVFHILANCMGLYFFGPLMERWWGSRKFLVFYLLSGVAGGVFFTLLAFAGILPFGLQSTLVGASAGIYGILAGIAVTAPAMRVALLFPPIEMSMRTMAIALLAIATLSILTGIGGNAGGEAGHLGGAIMGFLLVKFPHLLRWAGPHDPDVEIIPPRRPRRPAEAKLRPRSNVDLRQSNEVDTILDKISREGFQSLTADERATLERASGSKPTPR